MQVIADIITYLDNEGLLGRAEIERLRALGFLPGEWHNEYGDLYDADWAPYWGDHDDEEPEPETGVEGRPKRRPGSGRRKPPTGPEVENFSETVLAAWSGWEKDLEGFLLLARRFGSATDLVEALRFVRSARPEAIDAMVETVLHDGYPLFHALWRALAFDGHTELVPRSGPASTLGRSILAAAGAADLGRHSAMLRHEGLSRLLLLGQAQRAVLAGFGRLLAAKPALFDRPLFSRSYDPTAYWSLTFAVSALNNAGSMPLRLHEPARPWPDDRTEQRAWRCAAAMNGPATAALLVLLADGTPAFFGVDCPASWDIDYHPSVSRLDWVKYQLMGFR